MFLTLITSLSLHTFDCSGDPDKWAWSQPTVVGASPSPRTGATATALPGGRFILIAGGWDPDNTGGRASSGGGKADTAGKKSGSAPSKKAGATSGSASSPPAPGGKRKRGNEGAADAVSAAALSSPETSAAASSASDADDGAGKPFGDAYLLDTWEWEWLALSVPAAQTQGLLARVGHAAVPLVLGHGAGAAPAVALVGGVQGDSQRHNDVALVMLPRALLAFGGADSDTSAASGTSGTITGALSNAIADSDDDEDGIAMGQPDVEDPSSATNEDGDGADAVVATRADRTGGAMMELARDRED